MWRPKCQTGSLVFGFQAAGALGAPEGKKGVTRPVSPTSPWASQEHPVPCLQRALGGKGMRSLPHSFQPAVSSSPPTPTGIFPLPCSSPILGQPDPLWRPIVALCVQPSHRALANRRRGCSHAQTLCGACQLHCPQPGQLDRTPRAGGSWSWGDLRGQHDSG